MKKKKHVFLLVDFFNSDYYRAYDEMIKSLHPMLLTPQQNPRLIERLDFRPDLPRGSRKEIYMIIAKLLKPGDCVFAKKVRKNDFYRWLADPKHCNLNIEFQSIKKAVNESITSAI